MDPSEQVPVEFDMSSLSESIQTMEACDEDTTQLDTPKMDDCIDSESNPEPGRASSPSPSIPATPAVSSCPSPGRTFSIISSLSSATSADAISSMSALPARHGFIRPNGTRFAESARHRESVMSLGSIVHLQYYFARTGLLEGKGGNSREWKKKKKLEGEPQLSLTPNAPFGDELAESPTDEDDGYDEMMPPPTMSTYRVKTHHIPPPPDVLALRTDLRSALDKSENNIEDLEPRDGASLDMILRVSQGGVEGAAGDPATQSAAANLPSGWYEIHGMRVLDAVTLAIRATRVYYTAHERPERLDFIKPEKEMRQEMFHVLDVLKEWASRNFSGGLQEDERSSMTDWISGVREMLVKEEQLDELDAIEREGWDWAHGDWSGKEREREESFLHSLMDPEAPLPSWTPTDDTPLPTPMLERLRDGRDLVRIHNQAVNKSKRPFGQIKSCHQNVDKPYRCAENLRFWLKAAEFRWETKLEIDVMAVVHGSSDDIWKKFDTVLLSWCRAVREELIRDWQEPQTPPAACTPNDGEEVDAA